MATAVEEAKTLIDHLPADSSIEDIQYHLYVLEKVRKGQQDIQNGNSFTSEEAKIRLNKWLNP
jgi:hypothetical protein